MTIEPLGYLTLFIASFGAATILPLSSEAFLGALLLEGSHDSSLLWLTATGGNVAGALVNWWLGAYLLSFVGRRWFPFTRDQVDRASVHYERWGVWTLLLAWAPIIGDPLTFVAGMFRAPLPLFLLLVTIGKGGRYGAIIWLIA